MSHRPLGSTVAERLPAATLAGVAVGLALVLLPTPARDPVELGVAAGLGVALICLSLVRLASAAQLVVAVGYLLFAALLRDGAGGAVSGFAGLFFIPIIWLALTARRRELLLGLAAMFLALAVPLVAVGAPSYPSSGFRGAVVLVSVAVMVGLTIRHLVGLAWRAASEARHHAAEAEQATRLSGEQNKRLRELDAIKDDFIAVVSHELRTPLTSIVGFLEIVLDDGDTLTHDHQQFLRTVSRNVERLNLLVDDLLFLASTDAGKLKLQRQNVEIGELLRHAEQTARPRAEMKAISLNLEHGPLPRLEGDNPRLAQLLDNLISNAVKFTPEGGRVAIRAKRENGHLAIEIEDSGIGIPAEELPLLFGRFFRASTATENRIEGTGLGLAISKTIAEAHNGHIDVRSHPGQGTTFRVTLPIAPTGPAPITPIS